MAKTSFSYIIIKLNELILDLVKSYFNEVTSIIAVVFALWLLYCNDFVLQIRIVSSNTNICNKKSYEKKSKVGPIFNSIVYCWGFLFNLEYLTDITIPLCRSFSESHINPTSMLLFYHDYLGFFGI